MELSIDTSTRFASVGLSSRGQLFASATWRSQQNHSVELVPAILALMERHDVRRSQLEAIFVAVGPGGFSALRVGMSTAKAMAVALRIPVAPVGTLDVEAHPYLRWGTQVCALIEAGRRRVYQGRYPAGGELGPQYSVVDLDSLGTDVEDTTLYCGEAAKGLSGLLQAAGRSQGRHRRRRSRPHAQPVPSGGAGLGQAGERRSGRPRIDAAHLPAQRPGEHGQPHLGPRVTPASMPTANGRLVQA